ncbi:MAG: hypothetical protein AAGI92_05910 [Pseudomonadota bacterium]
MNDVVEAEFEMVEAPVVGALASRPTVEVQLVVAPERDAALSLFESAPSRLLDQVSVGAFSAICCVGSGAIFGLVLFATSLLTNDTAEPSVDSPGIVIAESEVTTELVQGREGLVIKAVLENGREKAQIVPPLRLRFADGTTRALSVAGQSQFLGEGERLTLTRKLPLRGVDPTGATLTILR